MTLPQLIDNYLKALAKVGIGYEYPGQTEKIEKEFLESYLKKLTDCVVFDVGCHVGAYTRTVKEILPQAKVYAFEPHPEAYKALSATRAMDGVNTFQCAMSDHEGEAEFYDNSDGSELPLASLHKDVIEKLHGKISRSFKVEVSTVDAMMRKLNVSRINLLKVDVEGNELSVFKGASEAIRNRKIDVLQFEFNDMNIISRTYFKDFYDYLSDFRLIRLTPNGGLPVDKYIPILHEVIALQTFIGFRKDLL